MAKLRLKAHRIVLMATKTHPRVGSEELHATQFAAEIILEPDI